MTTDEPTTPPQPAGRLKGPDGRVYPEGWRQPWWMEPQSLAEAQACKDGVVILDIDYGGQVVMVCPARLVRCSEEDLRQLASTFGEDDEGTSLSYQQLPVGAHVPGGMGGGEVTDGLWIHEELRGTVDEKEIREVIEGRRSPRRSGGRVRPFLVHLYLYVIAVWAAGRLLIGFLWKALRGSNR